MEFSIRILDANGNERELSGVKRDDWEGMNDSCPECGGREFNHVLTSGGHYGLRDGAVVMRSDFWDIDQSLFTQCRDCREILYKHPAYELIFKFEGDITITES